MARTHSKAQFRAPPILVPFTEEEEAAADAQDIVVAEASADYLANHKYKDDRRDEYPPIGDQLDALFHHGAFPDDMAATLQAVKDKYSKPE